MLTILILPPDWQMLTYSMPPQCSLSTLDTSKTNPDKQWNLQLQGKDVASDYFMQYPPVFNWHGGTDFHNSNVYALRQNIQKSAAMFIHSYCRMMYHVSYIPTLLFLLQNYSWRLKYACKHHWAFPSLTLPKAMFVSLVLQTSGFFYLLNFKVIQAALLKTFSLMRLHGKGYLTDDDSGQNSHLLRHHLKHCLPVCLGRLPILLALY